MADGDRPQYQHGVGTINGSTFQWGSGEPGRYWSIPYGDYPVTPNAPTGAWAHQAGAIPISNNIIPDPLLHRNRVGIMIHSGSEGALNELYTQGCFKVDPQDWPAVRSQILAEASDSSNPLYLHVAPGGVAAFTHTKTLSQAGAPPSDQSGPSVSSAAPSQGTTLNTSSVIDALSKNIAGIESGGWKNPYDALNPTTGAIGKYQVMPKNVPGWTMAATGAQMTPQEFQANPQAQEAVFRDQMQRSLQLYSPSDAASIWFTGKPFKAAGGNVSDANGTTNASYVTRATAGIPNPGTTINTSAPGGAPNTASTPSISGTPPAAAPAAAPATGVGGAVAALTQGTGADEKGPSALDSLQKLTNPDSSKQQQQQAATVQQPPQDMAGQQRLQQIAMESQQLQAQLQQRAAQPLTWGARPYGSNAGLQAPTPGTTLNSTGGLYG